ncbi:hypothetical protein J6590_063031 [Homalodisca vitripennis]|nr:hypothetical protein J6590_063031 [Homalodisca vitripennis]
MFVTSQEKQRRVMTRYNSSGGERYELLCPTKFFTSQERQRRVMTSDSISTLRLALTT